VEKASKKTRRPLPLIGQKCSKNKKPYKTRFCVAEKLKNPRILEIIYHTLRHWKATMLYHQTKDVLYVMKFLGHKNMKNTLIYIDLETTLYLHGAEQYYGKTAKTEDEQYSSLKPVSNPSVTLRELNCSEKEDKCRGLLFG
jgi:integrase